MKPAQPRGLHAVFALLPALTLALALTGVGTRSHADATPTVHPEYNQYEMSSSKLWLDDRLVEHARVFDRYFQAGRDRRHHSYLVTDVPGAGALIVKRHGLRIHRVRAEDIVVRDDMTRDLKADAVLTELGRVRIDPSTQFLLFELPKADGAEGVVRGVMKDPPVLLGWVDRQKVIESNSRFNKEIMEYTPDQAALTRLAAIGGTWRLDFYFSTRCPRCERYLPRVIATTHTYLAPLRSRDPKVTDIQLRFYGVPYGPGFSSDPEVRTHRISSLPAGILYLEGRPVRRIQGGEWDNPAAVLIEAMESATR